MKKTNQGGSGKRTAFRNFLAVVFLLFISVITVFSFLFKDGDNFSPFSMGRNLLNLSRRIVAECSAYLYGIYDPYAGKENRPAFGPDKFDKSDFTSNPDSIKSLLTSAFDIPSDSMEISNGDVRDVSGVFSFESFDQPLLDSLRTLYSLDTLFIGIRNDYEGFIKLRDWLNWYFRQRERRIENPESIKYNFNALDILHRAKNEKFWCSEYATTMVQCLASKGYTARYVMIYTEIAGHVLLEAWSDDYGKWLAVDPFFMFQVLRDGVPLSALEIHRLWRGLSGEDGLEVITKGPVTMMPNEKEFYLSLFRNFAIRMRNDWYSNPYTRFYPKSNSVMNAIEWQDEYTDDNIRYSWESGTPADLYWSLNNTRIYVNMSVTSPESVKLSFETFTPSFSHFELNVDGAVSRISSSTFEWKPVPGANHISVRAVNVKGVKGDSAYIDLFHR